MKGIPSLRIAGAMAFVAAAFSAMALRHEKQQALLKSGVFSAATGNARTASGACATFAARSRT